MKLDKEKSFNAISKILSNADSLIDDANILLQHSKLSRAYTLFQLAIEEVGKAALVYGFLLFEDLENTETQKSFLWDFTDHKNKTLKSLGMELRLIFITDDENIKKNILMDIENQIEHLAEMNNFKNYSLYTSLINGEFHVPSEIITKKHVEDIRSRADRRLASAKSHYSIDIDEFNEICQYVKSQDLSKLEEDVDEFIKDIINR